MAIKTFGIDHIHVNVRSMDRFRDLMKQLFDLDASRIGHIESIRADNATVRLALGMALNGADGATFQAMSATLGFGGLGQADINASYRS